MKVEVGSGWLPAEGFLHLDLNPLSPELDACCDVQDLPLRDESVDELRAVDILEHISYRRTERVLREWARVLMPGGRMFIQTPDAESMIHTYLSHPQSMIVEEFATQPRIVSLAWRLLGGHADNERVEGGGDFRLNAHYALFSMASLKWYLTRVGLAVESIGRNPFPNLQCVARKPA